MKCANRISENNFFDILDKLSKKSGTHLRIHTCSFFLVQIHNLLPQSSQCCGFLILRNLFCNRNIVFITARNASDYSREYHCHYEQHYKFFLHND